jgi:hypothetical protein
MSSQKLEALRQREAYLRGARNLARTRYEMTIAGIDGTLV